MLRPFMPDQHREFFEQLPFVVAGSVDAAGRPWASIVFGLPGFVTTPTNRRLVVETTVLRGDPLADNLNEGAPIGILGIELETRRRNRVNGVVSTKGNRHFELDVVQSFGNCPMYIQKREAQLARDPRITQTAGVERFDSLDETTTRLIRGADTFFVASYNDVDDKRDSGGVDVSHRGGRPGFVDINGNTLTIPDFAGNFAFNTLGNILVNPKAGLVFIDFENGDIVQLTGAARLLWEPTPETSTFEGAQRAWQFELHSGVRLREASPLTWQFGEYSPRTLATGDWARLAPEGHSASRAASGSE